MIKSLCKDCEHVNENKLNGHGTIKGLVCLDTCKNLHKIQKRNNLKGDIGFATNPDSTGEVPFPKIS